MVRSGGLRNQMEPGYKTKNYLPIFSKKEDYHTQNSFEPYDKSFEP
jgi:hypothetical protein